MENRPPVPRWLPPAALVASVLLVYGRVLGFGFIQYDDPEYVTANPNVLGGLTGENVAWAFTTFRAANWHPLTWLSLQLDATLFGAAAWGFHLTNVLLHAANAVLVYAIWARATKDRLPAFAAGLLFALHPQHVESVAWVTERKDVLSAFFGLLAVLAYVRYAERPGVGRYALVAAGLAASLLAKPMLVTLPFALLLLDYWPLNRTASVRRLVLEKFPLLLLAAGSCVMTVVAQSAGGAVGSLERFPLDERLANAVTAAAGYVAQTLAPVGLGAFYPHRHRGLADPGVVAAAAGLVAASALAAAFARRWPAVFVGWFWFVGSLVPVLGLVQVGTQAAADRYAYWPHVGLFAGIAWGVANCGRLTLARTAAAVAVSVCAVLTFMQAGVWADDATLWRSTLASAGPSATAHGLLGDALQAAGNAKAAEAEYRAAVALDPADEAAALNLGAVLTERGRPTEAVPVYRELLRVRPACANAHSGLGGALAQLGDVPAAVESYRAAIRLRPEYVKAHYNLGAVLSRPGTFAEAEQAFREALRLKPDFARAHEGLARVLVGQNRLADAEQVLRAAVGPVPGDPGLADLLARVYLRMGKPQEARAAAEKAVRLAGKAAALRLTLALALNQVNDPQDREEYAAASRLDPNWPIGQLRTAWNAAVHPDPTQRDPDLALWAARSVAEAFPNRAEGFDAWAAALAAKGDYAEAVKLARQALRVAGDNPPVVKEIAARVALYEAKKPFIDDGMK